MKSTFFNSGAYFDRWRYVSKYTTQGSVRSNKITYTARYSSDSIEGLILSAKKKENTQSEYVLDLNNPKNATLQFIITNLSGMTLYSFSPQIIRQFIERESYHCPEYPVYIPESIFKYCNYTLGINALEIYTINIDKYDMPEEMIKGYNFYRITYLTEEQR